MQVQKTYCRILTLSKISFHQMPKYSRVEQNGILALNEHVNVFKTKYRTASLFFMFGSCLAVLPADATELVKPLHCPVCTHPLFPSWPCHMFMHADVSKVPLNYFHIWTALLNKSEHNMRNYVCFKSKISSDLKKLNSEMKKVLRKR